jgi:hypothetical protein
MICPTGEVKYFCKGDSTQKCPTGKSPEPVVMHVDKFEPCPRRPLDISGEKWSASMSWQIAFSRWTDASF